MVTQQQVVRALEQRLQLVQELVQAQARELEPVLVASRLQQLMVAGSVGGNEIIIVI